MKGRNWQYYLSDGSVILRNVNSVDPQYDGWWIHTKGCGQERHVRISPALVLIYLRAERLARA